MLEIKAPGHLGWINRARKKRGESFPLDPAVVTMFRHLLASWSHDRFFFFLPNFALPRSVHMHDTKANKSKTRRLASCAFEGAHSLTQFASHSPDIHRIWRPKIHISVISELVLIPDKSGDFRLYTNCDFVPAQSPCDLRGAIRKLSIDRWTFTWVRTPNPYHTIPYPPHHIASSYANQVN